MLFCISGPTGRPPPRFSPTAENRAALGRKAITVWGPKQTRDGLLTGVMPVDSPRPPQEQLDRARARIAINIANERRAGTRVLVISDENMIGAPRRCLRQGRLYPDIGQRLARFAHAFDGQVTRAFLSIRSHESFWASVVSYGVARGHRVPDRAALEALAASPRLWRDVVLDVACALPKVELNVMPYEIFGGLPERVLEHMSGLGPMPRAHAREWMNQWPRPGPVAPDREGSRWRPQALAGWAGQVATVRRHRLARHARGLCRRPVLAACRGGRVGATDRGNRTGQDGDNPADGPEAKRTRRWDRKPTIGVRSRKAS